MTQSASSSERLKNESQALLSRVFFTLVYRFRRSKIYFAEFGRSLGMDANQLLVNYALLVAQHDEAPTPSPDGQLELCEKRNFGGNIIESRIPTTTEKTIDRNKEDADEKVVEGTKSVLRTNTGKTNNASANTKSHIGIFLTKLSMVIIFFTSR